MEPQQTDILIIGAGLTGLTTGFWLTRAGKDIHILEKADRVGGQIHTFREKDFVYESGPNTGVVSYPEVAELFEALSPACALETAREESKRRLIWKGNRFRALPSGLFSAVTTPLFTLGDKFRILGEPFRAKGNNPDESVGELAARRLGKSFLHYAVDPFLSGVYAGDPMKLVTRYALPKLYNLEQQYGSFIRGTIAKAKQPKTSDIYLHELLRYDVNISNAIASVAKEQSITDIVMGLHRDKSPAIFLGKITGDLLGESNVTTYIYKPVQPLATIKRHIVIIPSQAEKEAGFLMWLHKIGNLARNTGTKIVVYAPETTLKYIEPLRRKQTATVETVLFKDWEKLPALLRELRTDDCLWLVMSRRERISYQPAMNKIPAYLDQYLGRNSFVLIYPVQAGDPESRYL